MSHDDNKVSSRGGRTEDEYSRDKAQAIAKLFGGVASVAIGCCTWLFVHVLDLEKRVVRLETIQEIKRQSDTDGQQNNGSRNYNNIK